MKSSINEQIILFAVMFCVGILFNPMNMLAYNIRDIYFSLTLMYGAFLMASNMIWSHQIVHFINIGHFNKFIFTIGIILSMFSIFLLRRQICVNKNQWLKRMIGHHSTAITTTKQLLKNNDDVKDNPKVYKLAKDIIRAQEKEILLMKSLIK